MRDLTLAESALAQHEMLLSYIDAGFTREESMELLKTWIRRGCGTE